MKTIESLLISQGDLDRIYTGTLNLYLWRALHKEVQTSNPLYPDFDPREVRSGVLRQADVDIVLIDNVEHVVSRLRSGTSLFDRKGVFGLGRWTYFEIPAGTVIPPGLIITKDDYNARYQATHYTISPNYTMPKKRFTALLDQLAQNARAQVRKAGGRGA